MRYLLTSLLCVLTLSLTAQDDCPNPFDGNGNGHVGITDLLDLLAVFGDLDEDADGIWDSLDDCIDFAACNYFANPSEICQYLDAIGACGGDCTVDVDSDLICDDVDECVGYYDECEVCNGSGIPEGYCDCFGSVLDECDTCDDDPTNDCVQDCNEEWGGTAVLDECDTCDSDQTNDCVQDCNQEWGGTAELDECGVCDSDPTNDCVQDCNGDWGGLAALDECEVCDEDPENDCVQDCNEVWGGTAALDGCGVCDSDPTNDCVPDCNGVCCGTSVLDECGVCDGPGPTEIVIESITILYDSLYAEQIDQWWVYEVGADTVFNYTCTYSCGDEISHEGYDYSTVQIGEQCWFSENCRYLPVVSSSYAGSEISPYHYVYGYEGTDVEAAKATENYLIYGVLYNWPAVITEGICPIGWHIPSDWEFTQLTNFLGGDSVAGYAMKSTSGWSFNGNGSNSSGFNGVPGGIRSSGGLSYNGYSSYWWSSSESGSNSLGHRLYYDNNEVGRDSYNLDYGFSARCVRCEVDVDGDGICDNTDECIDMESCNYEVVPSEPCEYTSCAGCTDSTYCNYDLTDTIDDGSCEGDSDGDGICDSEDNCDGVDDECGICNGPGPTEIVNEFITIFYDSIYSDAISEWWVFETGADTTYTYECGFPCGDEISHEGYNYSTVQIGDQCWFSENCRYLPSVSQPYINASDTSSYYYVYGYEGTDVEAAKATENYLIYGVLYNWPAAMTEGICPSGWHIPSDWEFTQLTNFLGGDSVAGYAMKSTSGWWENGSNSSGFNGLPSGPDVFSGAHWWSSSEFGSSSHCWERFIPFQGSDIYRQFESRDYGYSARCVIDYTDECGVSNGDNSSCADCCGVAYGDGSSCDGSCGTCNDEASCLDECGIPNGDGSSCVFEACGDQLGHENYAYSTVQIGDQCWFSENCRYLPSVSPSYESSTTAPYYYVQDYQGADVADAKATDKYAAYGVLYNWPAVITEGICPSGWHIPIDGEFIQLIDYLGEDAGYQIKSTSGWNNQWNLNYNGSNSSGFNGLPGGYFIPNNPPGFFATGGSGQSSGKWWAYTEACCGAAWILSLIDYSTSASWGFDTTSRGFSARCVRCEVDEDGDGICDNTDECIDMESCNYEAVPSEPCEYTSCAGCTDSTYCNYDLTDTIDDGSCEGDSDGDGICDSEDWCDGIQDECGICNGPGPTELVIDVITILYDSIYSESISEWMVFETGTDTTYTYECGFICGNEITHEGYDYSTVQIGDQCWLSENCRYLPSVSPSLEYSSSEPYYYVYDYQGTDVEAAKSTENYATYGVLYNIPALMTEDVCPSGWHIPSDEEFLRTEIFLGMNEAEAAQSGNRGSPVGDYLKSTSGWGVDNSGNNANGSNSSGFNGLPGGRLATSGSCPGFCYKGSYGNFWTPPESGAWDTRRLSRNDNYIGRMNMGANNGYSARCIRDYTDECGIPNGDNSTCDDCCGIAYGDGSTCDGSCGACNDNSTCLDVCGVPNGDNTTCLDVCGVPNGDGICDPAVFNSCGDQINNEGYNYSTVQIGDQCWFSENCRYLPSVSPSLEYSSSEPYYYVYDYEGSNVEAAKSTENYATYGVLYNIPALMTEDVCPSGWHIPSDEEFISMEIFLGMSEADAAQSGNRGSPVGDYLKSTSGWGVDNSGNNANGSNSSGFNGLPGGRMATSGSCPRFCYKGDYAYFWTPPESGAWDTRRLSRNGNYIGRMNMGANNGYSARCLRDEP
jgi:uncharacterized protein (TIGR02145 family)